MAKENNRLLGHSDEADGIDEYDNPLPDWWLGLFWLTIVWALGYGVHLPLHRGSLRREGARRRSGRRPKPGGRLRRPSPRTLRSRPTRSPPEVSSSRSTVSSVTVPTSKG